MGFGDGMRVHSAVDPVFARDLAEQTYKCQSAAMRGTAGRVARMMCTGPTCPNRSLELGKSMESRGIGNGVAGLAEWLSRRFYIFFVGGLQNAFFSHREEHIPTFPE